MSKEGNPLMKLIRNEITIECQLCKATFSDPVSTLKHLEEVHGKDFSPKRRKAN